ncbi:hypothetical protein [Siccirubricoccus phaeus]|uniref:hypothetical protein n=1 Tax=Siccirubricoccus phaeus TaxID=2595053 RepID=UPI001F27547A|nr:hypothetical protein [Siccirubricoccus phaeus]
MSQVEMGQAAYTAMSMLIVEELEVGLNQIRVVAAPPDDGRFAKPGVGFSRGAGRVGVAFGGSRLVSRFRSPVDFVLRPPALVFSGPLVRCVRWKSTGRSGQDTRAAAG